MHSRAVRGYTRVPWDRIYKAIPSLGGSRKGEGSILGGLGNLIDGD